jgi:tripartite motif-containing protein 71
MKRALLVSAMCFCLALLFWPLAVTSAQAAPGDFLYFWGARQHFMSPQGITCDKNGNIYVVDFGWDIGHVVQVFNNSGERLRKWGSFGSGDGQFDFPTGIAVDGNGNVYVADSNNDRIQVFDSSGKFLRKWGTTGTGNGQFDFPVGLAFDGSGNLYVADANNNRVQVFDSTGHFIRKWGSAGTGDGHFNYDTGIAIDGSGHVYVVDSLNQRVEEFDTSGNFLRKWGSDGDGDGQFRSPFAITVDPGGRVYVTDTLTELVQEFDGTGKFLTKWGGAGNENGHFNGPYGITCGSGGEIFIVDQNNDRVQVFNSSGTFLRKWWSHDPGPGEMSGPIQTVVDANDNVYVADSGNYRADVFTAAGAFLRMWGLVNGQDFSPTGIALDGKGGVYVVTPPGGSIQAYDTVGKFLRQWFVGIPLRLTADPAGNIWTIDPETHEIQAFDSLGNEVKSWGGLEDPNIGAPGSIAIDAAGTVYLTDRENRRVNIYDSAGNFLRKFGEGIFPDMPEGIAVDSGGHIFVIVGDFVYAFANNGTLLQKWGGFGDTDGLFINPTEVSVDRSGSRIFVSDTGNSRIQVFQGFGEQLPAGWSGRDIGNVGVAGAASAANGVFTVRGSGADIWGTADAFHYLYKPLTGDGAIIARVTAVQNTNSYAKGGVMIRQSLTPNSAHAMVDITPGHGAEFSRRVSAGGSTSVSSVSGIAAPYWVKLVRQGNTFSAFIGKDGTSWNLVGSATISMTGSVYIGLIANSHNNAVLGTSTFDAVSTYVPGDTTAPTVTAFTVPATSSSRTVPITTFTATDNVGVTGYLVTESASKPAATASGWCGTAPANHTFASTGTKTLYAWAKDAAGNVSNSRSALVTVSDGGLPTPWLTQDIGSVGLPGSAGFLNGVFTLKGSGADIWGTADAFRFVYKVMTGDGQIIARVSALQNTNPYAKGGVMIRQSLAANSMHAMMDLRPTGGAEFSRRTSTGGTTAATTKTGIAAPYWVRLVRSGSTFTGSVSSDGANWVQVGSSTINMTGSVYVGLIVNSHNNPVLCTATIDGVK